MFKGIFTALLTPFDQNGRINDKALERLVKHNIKMGVKGFYVCGSTGEAFLLSRDERKHVMETVRAVAPDSTLIAHVGSINEEEAIDLAVYAEKLGYNAVSSVTPFYYKFSFDEIKSYYFGISNSVSLPMLVYYIPSFSGVNMGVKEISQFLDNDKFLGIKYTSNDFFTMEQCKTNFPDKIVYNGFDEMLLSGLAMGADGGIGSTYNFMADKFVKIRELFMENKTDEAQRIQREANRIITLLCKFGVMQAEKEVLCQLGMDFGVCRRPFSQLNDEQKKIVATEIIPYITPYG